MLGSYELTFEHRFEEPRRYVLKMFCRMISLFPNQWKFSLHSKNTIASYYPECNYCTYIINIIRYSSIHQNIFEHINTWQDYRIYTTRYWTYRYILTNYWIYITRCNIFTYTYITRYRLFLTNFPRQTAKFINSAYMYRQSLLYSKRYA